MAAPTVVAGAVQVTTDAVFTYDVPDTPVGAPGTVAGVTELDAADGLPVPAALMAATVNV